jgi:hypothetical protein
MKKLFIILSVSIFLFQSCSDSSIDLSDSNLKCDCESYCLDKGLPFSDTITHILLYKNKPFSGSVYDGTIEKNTGVRLSLYNCEYLEGKRHGVEKYESWVDNKPFQETTIRWSNNIKISSNTKDVSHHWKDW